MGYNPIVGHGSRFPKSSDTGKTKPAAKHLGPREISGRLIPLQDVTRPALPVPSRRIAPNQSKSRLIKPDENTESQPAGKTV